MSKRISPEEIQYIKYALLSILNKCNINKDEVYNTLINFDSTISQFSRENIDDLIADLLDAKFISDGTKSLDDNDSSVYTLTIFGMDLLKSYSTIYENVPTDNSVTETYNDWHYANQAAGSLPQDDNLTLEESVPSPIEEVPPVVNIDDYFANAWQAAQSSAPTQSNDDISQDNQYIDPNIIQEVDYGNFSTVSATHYKGALGELFTESKSTNYGNPSMTVDYVEDYPTTNVVDISSDNYALMQSLEDGILNIKEQLNNKGYGVRPYSKFNSSTTYYENSHMYNSKIKLETSLLTYFIILIEFFSVYFVFNPYAGLSITKYLIAGGGITAIFIAYSAYCLATINRKKFDRYNYKSALINSTILFMPMLVIIFSIAIFVLKVELNSFKSYIVPIIYPIIFILNIYVYNILYNIVYRTKKYHLK